MMQRKRAAGYGGGSGVRKNNPYHAGTPTRSFGRPKSTHGKKLYVLFFMLLLATMLGIYTSSFETSKVTQTQTKTNGDSIVKNVGVKMDEHEHIIDHLSNPNGDAAVEAEKSQNEESNDSGKSEALSSTATTTSTSTTSYISTREAIQSIKGEFYTRYGGKDEALAMLQRGILPASGGSSKPENDEKATRHTAERIIRAKNRKLIPISNEEQEELEEDGVGDGDGHHNQFVIAFGGYSVTVGRGNFYNQSYPFIMQNVLKPVFKSMGLELVVRNSAIGGIPSFPYGFCLPNFLGMDADVVSWDYGMNEGNGAEAFESYLRHSISTLPKRPMMIMLDTKARRVDMLKKYFDNGSLMDSIAVGRADVAVNKHILEKAESDRPEGFQKWDEWGGPKGSPGQSSWHPKYKEHEMIGWMIAIHFLDALEKVADILEAKDTNSSIDMDDAAHEKLVLLPKPESAVRTNGGAESPSHLLYGVPLDDEAADDSRWHMDPVSCRTSFLPNEHGGMTEIIASGLAEGVGDDLESRDDSQYNDGWVVDVGKVERDTKRKVKKHGGMGYIDMKNALYGIPGSGTLQLELPHEGPNHGHKHSKDTDMLASHWFDTLVFCEVNEKRGDNECKPDKDITYTVGGVEADVVQITSAAAYLNKSLCVNVSIPKDARVSLKEEDGAEENQLADHEKVYLKVDVTVTGEKVTRKDGACSISHIVWQSH